MPNCMHFSQEINIHVTIHFILSLHLYSDQKKKNKPKKKKPRVQRDRTIIMRTIVIIESSEEKHIELHNNKDQMNANKNSSAFKISFGSDTSDHPEIMMGDHHSIKMKEKKRL